MLKLFAQKLFGCPLAPQLLHHWSYLQVLENMIYLPQTRLLQPRIILKNVHFDYTSGKDIFCVG